MTYVLSETLSAWSRADFARVLQTELQDADALSAPLQRGLARGSFALVDTAQLLVLQRAEDAGLLRVKAAVCYQSIIPGCACEGDPTPMSELPEYVELTIAIDRADGRATITLLDD
ncbi:hypothetical protein GALL_269950 [mine drainage metagenome]|uniref:Uncharacterized protein n=1 Tax=mine drainage metagenome TaxID=410659 RepID=A0A1J5RNL2_9ZZZZ